MESTRLSRMLGAALLAMPAAHLYAQQSPGETGSDSAPAPRQPPIVHTPAVNSALDLSELDEPIETPSPQPVEAPQEPPPTAQSDVQSSGVVPVAAAMGPPIEAPAPVQTEQAESSVAESPDRPLTEIPRRARADDGTGRSDRQSESKALTPWYRNPLIGLGVVLVLILAAAKLLRKYVPAARPIAPSVMRVVGRMALSGKQSVVLVHVGRRMVLVGVTGDRMVTLSEIDDAEEVCLLLGRLGEKSSRSIEFDSRLAEQFGRYEVDHVDLEEDEGVVDEGDEQELLHDARGHLQQLMTRLRSLQAT